MAVEPIIIRSIPKITPNQISVIDTDNLKKDDNNTVFSKDQTTIGYSQRKGLMTPIVKLGGVLLPGEMVKSLQVRYDDILPRISITIIDENGVFGAGGYPLSNIIASIFIQPQNSKLKSLTGDYLITNVSSIPIPGRNVTVYTVNGELHVPKLNGQFSKSFSNLSSLGVLKKVADELQLGFADNQPEDTQDIMTWLMPNYSYKSFINHVKKMAYAGDKCFFDCFIDRYYILNFINVEKMFVQDQQLEKSFISLVQTAINKSRSNPEKDEVDDTQTELILSNYKSLKGSETFIKEFSLTGQHGEVLLQDGLQKEVYWYDHGGNTKPNDQADDINFITNPVEPIFTPAGNDGFAPHTAIIDEYTNLESVIGSWKGVDYGNAHPQYKFAHLLNHHNLKETTKNMLKIRLDGISTTVLRGSRIPVAIFLEREAAMAAAKARKEAGDDSDQKAETETGNPTYDNNVASEFLDKSLSGFYYVSSITYEYHDGKFDTHMMLARRHWLLPRPKNETPT